MAASCTVRFKHGGAGPSAVLMWRGRSLNYIAFPKGQRVTVAAARRAKAQLMRGCAGLVRDEQRRARRRR